MAEMEDHTQDQHNAPDNFGSTSAAGYAPKPANVAQPTYWPIILAAGITLFGWGWVTSLLMTALGLILIVASIVNWIGDIRHDRGYEQAKD